jgi:hypothetical protein
MVTAFGAIVARVVKKRRTATINLNHEEDATKFEMMEDSSARV